MDHNFTLPATDGTSVPLHLPGKNTLLVFLRHLG